VSAAADAFEVEHTCQNCGDSWTTSHPARTKVGITHSQAHIWNKDCNSLGTNECDCCEVVGCPTCELYEDVTITDRRVLDAGGESA
jgi:hypothetical protein